MVSGYGNYNMIISCKLVPKRGFEPRSAILPRWASPSKFLRLGAPTEICTLLPPLRGACIADYASRAMWWPGRKLTRLRTQSVDGHHKLEPPSGNDPAFPAYRAGPHPVKVSRAWSFRGRSNPIPFVGNERAAPAAKASRNWRKAEESNPTHVSRTEFSRLVAGPSPLHHLPDILSCFDKRKQEGIIGARDGTRTRIFRAENATA